MESAPAAFVGTVCALFGAALLLWTSVRLHQGEPVVVTAHHTPAAAHSVLLGVAFLTTGLWLLLRV